MLQLFLFGFAVDTNVRQIATVVLDESQTQESRRLLERFAGSDVFDLRIYAHSPAEMYEAIRAGRARAGSAFRWIMRDGCRMGRRRRCWCWWMGRTRAWPARRSAHRRAWRCRSRWCGCCRTVRCRLKYAHRCCITRQRGRRIFCAGADCDPAADDDDFADCAEPGEGTRAGTLEQLTMTPVAPLGLMVGKMIPYGVLAFGELCAILVVMRSCSRFPMHGNVFLLLALSVPFLMTVLGIGLVISTQARRRPKLFSYRWARFCLRYFFRAIFS